MLQEILADLITVTVRHIVLLWPVRLVKRLEEAATPEGEAISVHGRVCALADAAEAADVEIAVEVRGNVLDGLYRNSLVQLALATSI